MKIIVAVSLVIIVCIIILITQETKAQGQVIQNDKGCYVDGSCVLQVKSNSKVWNIIYDIGWGACKFPHDGNYDFQINDFVEFYVKNDNYLRGRASICDKEKYYIKNIVN